MERRFVVEEGERALVTERFRERVELGVVDAFGLVSGVRAIQLGTPLHGLGLRDLDLIQVACVLEHDFGVEIEAAEVDRAGTVADVVAQVLFLLSGEAAATGG